MKEETKMPLVKQGKYKEYYDKCKSIREKNELCHYHYFGKDGNYNSNYEVFSDFFYSVDEIYKEAIATKRGLEGLIEFSEQKTEKSIKKCEDCISEMESVINNCIDDFKLVYDYFGNDFTDAERDTLENFEIMKEIL